MSTEFPNFFKRPKMHEEFNKWVVYHFESIQRGLSALVKVFRVRFTPMACLIKLRRWQSLQGISCLYKLGAFLQ